VITVQEPDRRAAIAKLCAGQSQVTEAPWFFAFIADHHRLKTAATKVGESSLGLSYVEYLLMAIVDASLAAERMVCAAESLGLGCCYIGALRDKPAEIKSLFGLPARTMGVFGLCLGYPNLPVESYIRPRLDPETVWFKERYSFEVDIAGFESRMSEFYEREQMQGDYRWAKRSGRRVDRNHLTGREVLKEWLAAQGMGTE
jgi:nitroreductase